MPAHRARGPSRLHRPAPISHRQRGDAQPADAGQRIEIFRIPTPEHTLEVFSEGDATYDYFAAYEDWEDGSTFPVAAQDEPAKGMLAVWASSYVNYVPTNDLVLVSRFGDSQESVRRDKEAAKVLRRLFPGREVVGVSSANVNRGGGGMNCITQQQPASAKFAQRCGWAKVQVAAGQAPLFREAQGAASHGLVERIARQGDKVYLQRLGSRRNRVNVRVAGGPLRGQLGWVEAEAIESAGEKCMGVYRCANTRTRRKASMNMRSRGCYAARAAARFRFSPHDAVVSLSIFRHSAYPRPLHENATSWLCSHEVQRRRAKPRQLVESSLRSAELTAAPRPVRFRRCERAAPAHNARRGTISGPSPSSCVAKRGVRRSGGTHPSRLAQVIRAGIICPTA